jgi:PKD repeat protein
LTVNFRSVLQDTTATYSWSFGDGNSTSGRNPSHTYAAAGQYVVVLAVSRLGSSASQSCTDTAWMRISVPGHRRPRLITNPTPVPPPAPCASNYLVVPDTTPLGYVFVARPVSNRRTYAWTFGDGTTGTGPVVRHTYASAGSYTVCLTVTDTVANCTFNRCDTLVASTLRSGNGGGLAPRTGSANASVTLADIKLSVYPNPTRDVLHLTFQGGLGQASARVMDLTGRIVLTQSFRLTQGIQQETLQVENLPVGTYVLTLDKEGKKEYFRFVKQ